MRTDTSIGPAAFAAAFGHDLSFDVITRVPVAFLADDGDVWLLVGGSGSWSPQFRVQAVNDAVGDDTTTSGGIYEPGVRLILTTDNTGAPNIMTLDFQLHSVQISGVLDAGSTLLGVELDGHQVNIVNRDEVGAVGILRIDTTPVDGDGVWFDASFVRDNPDQLPIGNWNGNILRVVVPGLSSHTPHFELSFAAGEDGSAGELLLVETVAPPVEAPEPACNPPALYEIAVSGLAAHGFNGGTRVQVLRIGDTAPQNVLLKAVRGLRG